MAKTYDELLREAEALPKHERPGMFSRMAGHPGILTHYTKTPEQYDADQRRSYVLDRLRSVDDRPRMQVADPDNDPGALNRYLKSPYAPYAAPGFKMMTEDGDWQEVPGQYLGEDSPIWKYLEWGGNLPSALANLQKAGGNAADYVTSKALGAEPAPPYPGQPFAKAQENLRDFMAPLSPSRVYRETDQPGRETDLKTMRGSIQSLPWQVLDPRPSQRLIQESYPTNQESTIDTLLEAKIPPAAAVPLGTVMNLTADPLSSFGTAPKLARAGKNLAAYGDLGRDFMFGVSPEAVLQIRELLRPKDE